MPRIQQLSPEVIAQVKAGEVIERPASVVKELLENSVDAGASRIDVEVLKGGQELIRVVDNGCGMEPDDLSLAFHSHATSKLRSARELFEISTLGFRGEGLASIGGIAQVTLQSRPPQLPCGAEIRCHGGQITPPRVWNGTPGTRIEVRHLFFNTPVRRKFLRSPSTEFAQISEAFIRVALAQLSLHLTLRHNGKLVHEVPASAGLLDRIGLFFGKEVRDKLYMVQAEEGRKTLAGYVSDPFCDRGSPELQYLFVNGRWIRDRGLSQALQEAYRGLLMSGRHPIAFLFLEIPPNEVDVNVHPTKAEVRFRQPEQVHHLVRETVREQLQGEDLTAPLRPPPASRERVSAGEEERAKGREGQEEQRQEGQTKRSRQADPESTREGDRDRGLFSSPPPRSPSPAAKPLPCETLLPPPEVARVAEHRTPGSAEVPASPPHPPVSPPHPPAPSPTRGEGEPRGPLTPAPSPTRGEGERRRLTSGISEEGPVRAIQVHDLYLVVEVAEGILLIDQHALHERILFEQLLDKFRRGTLETQKLLIPEPVSLSAPQAALVLEHREALGELGLLVEDFGGATILVQGCPALLSKRPAREVFQGVVDYLVAREHSPSREALLNDLLSVMACHAAIRAGDRLTPEEIQSLLSQRHLAQDAHHCPHGRPTSLLFTRQDLDRQFRR
jgi:DNA mismatch repair protein MutL